MIALALLLITVGPNAPLTATVEASSTRPETDPGMLVDGKLDTAWQADADGAFSLGQWVRLDFGRVVEVTRVEIDNGVQRVVGQVDHFCTEGRATLLQGYGDDGRIEFMRDQAGDLRRFEAEVGEGLGLVAPLRTRTLTLVIDAVEKGFVHQGAVGISEVRVWGREAPEPPAETGDVACNSRRLGLLRAALVEHCARTYRTTRPPAECSIVRGSIDACGTAPPKWLPIADKAFQAGLVELAFTVDTPRLVALSAKLTRDTDGEWDVASLTCTRDNEPCGPRSRLASHGVDLQVTERKACMTATGGYMFPP